MFISNLFTLTKNSKPIKYSLILLSIAIVIFFIIPAYQRISNYLFLKNRFSNSFKPELINDDSIIKIGANNSSKRITILKNSKLYTCEKFGITSPLCVSRSFDSRIPTIYAHETAFCNDLFRRNANIGNLRCDKIAKKILQVDPNQFNVFSSEEKINSAIILSYTRATFFAANDSDLSDHFIIQRKNELYYCYKKESDEYYSIDAFGEWDVYYSLKTNAKSKKEVIALVKELSI
ncbi:hypothetical protein [Leptospira alstonii]|uniref:hypothetical protein n=1 Tax=Leptospira alstonii TaxID=28452 RepID=UPI0007736110|nr:hypothetical protein [Leptospira alstonii]